MTSSNLIWIKLSTLFDGVLSNSSNVTLFIQNQWKPANFSLSLYYSPRPSPNGWMDYRLFTIQVSVQDSVYIQVSWYSRSTLAANLPTEDEHLETYVATMQWYIMTKVLACVHVSTFSITVSHYDKKSQQYKVPIEKVIRQSNINQNFTSILESK